MSAQKDRSAAEMLSAGYAASSGPEKKGPVMLAAMYRPDESMERLRALKLSDPAAFADDRAALAFADQWRSGASRGVAD